MRCPEEKDDCIGRHLVNSLQDMGRAHEKLKMALENPVFDNLSKHCPFWHSEHDDEANKLYETRCRVIGLSEILGDVLELLDHTAC